MPVMDKAPPQPSSSSVKRSLWKFAAFLAVVLVLLCLLKSCLSSDSNALGELSSEKALATIEPVEKPHVSFAYTDFKVPSTVQGKNGSVYHLIDRTGGGNHTLHVTSPAEEVKALEALETIKTHSHDTHLNITNLEDSVVSISSSNASNVSSTLSSVVATLAQVGKTALENAQHRTIVAFGDSLTYGDNCESMFPFISFLSYCELNHLLLLLIRIIPSIYRSNPQRWQNIGPSFHNSSWRKSERV